MPFLLVTGVENQSAGAGHILWEEDFSIATVQSGNLNVLQDWVSPVKVTGDPVHRYTLRYHQTSGEDLQRQVTHRITGLIQCFWSLCSFSAGMSQFYSVSKCWDKRLFASIFPCFFMSHLPHLCAILVGTPDFLLWGISPVDFGGHSIKVHSHYAWTTNNWTNQRWSLVDPVGDELASLGNQKNGWFRV